MFDKRFDDVFLIQNMDNPRKKKILITTMLKLIDNKFTNCQVISPEIVQESILFVDDKPCLFSMLFDTITTFKIAKANSTTCNIVIFLRIPVWCV